MEVTISIECETISDLYTHLGVLRKQLKSSTKKLKLNPNKDEFPGSQIDLLFDSNCYGDHEVCIFNEP